MSCLKATVHTSLYTHYDVRRITRQIVSCKKVQGRLQHLASQHLTICHVSKSEASTSPSSPRQQQHNKAPVNTRQGGSSSSPADFLEPFSTVDPAVRSDITGSPSHSNASSPSDSGSNQDVSTDKWGETLAVNHTLSSLYLRKVKVQPFQQLDLAERRRKRELQEICEAAAKKGVKADVITANLQKLQGLVPGLFPNMDQMKASDWAAILKNVDGVVSIVITLKTFYPKVDVGKLLQRTPKLLLKPLEQIQADAQQVKGILARVEDVDAIIDAVPYLMDPLQLQQSLGNLARWFPNQDPFDVLQKNPTMLVNIEEADLEADPLYGMPTIDPSCEWPLQP